MRGFMKCSEGNREWGDFPRVFCAASGAFPSASDRLAHISKLASNKANRFAGALWHQDTRTISTAIRRVSNGLPATRE